MEILYGWDYEQEVKWARSRDNARERREAIQDADALRELQRALDRVRRRGLCVYCGSKMLPCFCCVDDYYP